MRTVLRLCPLSAASAENVPGFRSFWLGNAVRHMVELQVSVLRFASLCTLTRFQVNRKSALDDLPEDLRQAMAASWWLASLADAHSAAYWRVSKMLHHKGLDSNA